MIRMSVDNVRRTCYLLIEDLGAIDNFGLPGVEHLADLPGHEGLAGAWWSVQENALHVFTAKLLHDLRREHTGGECSSGGCLIRINYRDDNIHLNIALN